MVYLTFKQRHAQIPYTYYGDCMVNHSVKHLSTSRCLELMPTHAQNIMTFIEWMMNACKHVNQPLCQVPMPREAFCRATDPNHGVPMGDRHRWDGNVAARTLGCALIHHLANTWKPASCEPNFGILRATSPDVLWLPGGWRGVSGSYCARSCHSQSSLRSATGRLPAKTWCSMSLYHYSLDCLRLCLEGMMGIFAWHWVSDIMTMTTQHQCPSPLWWTTLSTPYWACSAVNHSSNVSWHEASALPPSISDNVFTTASHGASARTPRCLIFFSLSSL